MATDRPRGAELTLTRLIGAPPEVVFEVWTRPEHLVEWWGPAGYGLPGCELDFRVGGGFRYQMRDAEGRDHWLRGVFREIVEPERIAFTFAWGDAERATGPVTLVTVRFEAHAGKTRVTLHQAGLESQSAARAHEDGWSTQFDRLAAFAAEVAQRANRPGTKFAATVATQSEQKEPTEMTPKNTICLWFDKDAEDAARFYAATFPNSKVTAVHHAPGDFPGGKARDVLTVEFSVFGIPCLGLNGGPHFKHSEAFSFQIATDDQQETDRYWNAIVGNGGKESECGWCKDRWGLSWQITPRVLTDALAVGGAEAKRAFDAMMKMKKIDVAQIEAARRG